MKVTTKFNVEAQFEIGARICDFHALLMERAMKIANAGRRMTVTRRDVENAAKELVRES